MSLTDGRTAVSAPLLAGVGCYVVWGLSVLVYQQMGQAGASAWEILAHRALWSVLWAGALVVLAKQTPQLLSVLKTPRTLAWLALSTALISTNWFLFVWAVNNGRTLDTSFGYYVNPLMNMAAGALLFRERIDRTGKIAIGLAAAGVLVQGVALGHPPWISLALATTFWLYGLIRKQIAADAQTGLFVECLYLALPGLLVVAWLQGSGEGHAFDSPVAFFWLFMAGPVTVAPLFLFAWAARRMPLSGMGFLQFLAPTISFAIGVAQGEEFGWLRGVSFAFIWAGAALFAWGLWRKARRVAAA